MCVYAYVYVCAHVSVCMYVCVCVCMLVRVYAYVHVCAHVRVCVCVCVYMYYIVWKPVIANHMYPDIIITDSYALNNSEKFYKLATQGKDINELRKTKQKYITYVSKHTQLT